MTTTTSIIEGSAVGKLLPKKDNNVGKVKVKRGPPKSKQDDDAANPQSPPSPLFKSLDSSLRGSFHSGRPMEDVVDLVQCKHCKKPMLRSVAFNHIKVCLQKKNERAQKKKEQTEANRNAREAAQRAERAEEDAAGDAEGDDDSVNGEKTSLIGKKSAIKGSSSMAKKRKAEDEGDNGSTKKKTKKELEAAKPKAKPKGPVDVEKQCGVLLANGQMCARSLTCKSHSMGAKRAVPGRSLPYDRLLAAYQKKNQAKQQKAAIDANAPLLDDVVDSAHPIDSDEERDLVMAGVARSHPRPLEQHMFVPIRRKYNYLRVKEMLSSAFGGGRGNIFGGTQSMSTVVGERSDEENRRPSLTPIGGNRPPLSAGLGPSRKASLTTAPVATAVAA